MGGPLRQFDGLGTVTLEVKTECAATRQNLELAVEVGSQLRVALLYLPNQVGHSRHVAGVLPVVGADENTGRAKTLRGWAD
jgi:hypothetical protein